MSTILIKNARMRGHQELTDLYIKDGVFAEIGGGLSYPADEVIDVAGKLVTEPQPAFGADLQRGAQALDRRSGGARMAVQETFFGRHGGILPPRPFFAPS